MERRRFLTGCMAVAALTGCVSSDSDSEETTTEQTTDQTVETTPEDGGNGDTETTVTDDGGSGETTTERDDDGSTEEGTTVRLVLDHEWADAQDVIVDALHEAGLSEDVEVEITPGEFSYDARRSEYRSALEAGRSDPDIFMMDSGWTMPFIVREQLLNLSEEMSSESLNYVRDNYIESGLRTTSHPETGDLHGLPVFPDYPVMHYRRDLVEEAGYDPEGENWATEPMTWQEFAEIAADAWDQSDVEYGFTTQGDDYEGTSCCTFNEMMTSWGGAYFGDHENLFGPVGDRPVTVDEQPVHDTIRMMRSFMEGPDAEHAHPEFPQITTLDIADFTEEPARQPFTNGDAVFMRNWTYAIRLNETQASFRSDEYGVMPMPYGVEAGQGNYEGTGGSSHAYGGWNLTVNPHSDNVSDAVAVLEAFTTEDVMLTALEELGHLPPVPEVLEQADPDRAGPLGPYLDTLAVAARNTVPRPVTRAWTEESPLISQEINSAYRGVKSPSQAMAELADELRTVEDQFQT